MKSVCTILMQACGNLSNLSRRLIQVYSGDTSDPTPRLPFTPLKRAQLLASRGQKRLHVTIKLRNSYQRCGGQMNFSEIA